MGIRARPFRWPPLRLTRLRCERGCVGVVCPQFSRLVGASTKGAKVRAIGLNVHRDFCEIAIADAGNVRSAGRIATQPDVLELFAQRLAATDQVVLEVTGNAWE